MSTGLPDSTSRGSGSYRIAIFTTHPIQYQTPLFQAFAAHEKLSPTVFFASRHGLEVSTDTGFGQSFKWDVPLLEGYEQAFLKNRARKPDVGHFLGLNVPSIFGRWRRGSFDAYLVMGWKNLAHWQAIGVALAAGGPLLLRGDSQLTMRPRSEMKAWIRSKLWLPIRQVLYRQLFARTRAILTVGQRNKEYYRHFDVPDSKLFRAPHCVSNEQFHLREKRRSKLRNTIRKTMGIDENAVVFVSVAKFIPKKHPFDLLDAFAELGSVRDDVHLLYVGDGPMYDELSERVSLSGLEGRVTMAGFINQSKLPAYYAAADTLVLPSGPMETWGLVTNEAMAAGLSVIVSKAAGCAPDLVRDGENGLTFPHRDVEALTERMARVAQLPEEERQAWGRRSQEIISDFTPTRVANVLAEALEDVVPRRDA